MKNIRKEPSFSLRELDDDLLLPVSGIRHSSRLAKRPRPRKCKKERETF